MNCLARTIMARPRTQRKVTEAQHVLHSPQHGGGAGPGRCQKQRVVDGLHDDLLQAPLLPHVGDEGVCEYLILQAFVVELLNNLINCGPGFGIKLQLIITNIFCLS